MDEVLQGANKHLSGSAIDVNKAGETNLAPRSSSL